MAQYILLPYEAPEVFAQLSPADMQAVIQRYIDWTEKLAATGSLRAGHKLRDGEGRIMRGAGEDMTVTDGPFPETKEVLGGLWIIEADSYDVAVKLASDCPHLEYGSLVIRAIED